jgi:menaquinone-9 beta-reductase
VAGAGPAGAVAALLLARAGVRVRLLDRAVFPRDKLCGDTLNPGALAILRRLGLAADIERRSLPVRGMIVTGMNGVRITGEYGGTTLGASLRRRDLDLELVHQAAADGASFEPGMLVEAPLVEEVGRARRVIGIRVITASGIQRDLRAPLTIAADGRHSRVARRLGLVAQPVDPRRWAIGAYFRDVPVSEGLGEMHIRGCRYIGVAPVPGALVNACVVVSNPRAGALADPGALLLATLRRDPLLADRFANATMVTAPVVLGPLAVDASAAGCDGLLLAGDAAGFIDPMTGDGLRFAFRGAELAASVAVKALAGSIGDAAAMLGSLRRREFASKWRLNRALRALVASPRAVGWAAAAAPLCPPVVRHLIERAGDVPR